MNIAYNVLEAEFTAAINKFGTDVKSRADDILLASSLELHKSIRVGSDLTGSPGAPIKTGYLRNSIQIGRGEAISFLSDGAGPGALGLVPAAPDTSSMAGLKVGEGVTIATNCVYAEVQEHMHKTNANHWALSVAGWGRIVTSFINQLLV